MFEHLTSSELLERWRHELTAAGLVPAPDWDGYRPASDAALQESETRIGRPLPPSYREFLALSDGWPACGAFVSGLRPASTVGWFRDLEAEWYQIWRDVSLEQGADDPDFDVELMGRALVVSEPGEQALLLDPDDVDTSTGEWACYTFSNWAPGSNEAGKSFRSGLEHLYRDFVAFNEVATVTETESADAVELAYQAMLSGDLTARALLEDLRLLSWRAWALAAQFDVFGAAQYEPDSSMSVQSLWRGSLRGRDEHEALTDPLVLNELLPMWLVRLHESRWGSEWEPQGAPDAIKARIDQLVRQIHDGTGPIADFSYCPRFKKEVERARAQIAAGDLERAWQTVEAALPLWTPMSDDHLAPIGLYFDKDLRLLLTPPASPPSPGPQFPIPPHGASGPKGVSTVSWVRGSSTGQMGSPEPPRRLPRKLHSERTLAVLAVPYRRQHGT